MLLSWKENEACSSCLSLYKNLFRPKSIYVLNKYAVLFKKYVNDCLFQKSFRALRPLTLQLLASQGAILLKHIEHMLLINLHHFKDAYTKSFCLGKGFMLPWSHLSTFQLHRSGAFRWRSTIQSSWTIWGIFQSSFQCSLLWLLKKLLIPFFMLAPSGLFQFATPFTLTF